MSHPLSPAELTRLRTLLQENRAELENQMVQNKENLTPQSPELGAVLQRNEAREIDQALTNIDSADLARIDQALKRMDVGEYGQCADCGCDIPFARLEVEPQTQYCVACKSKREEAQAAR